MQLFTAFISTDKKIAFAAQSERLDSIFNAIVVNFDDAIGGKHGEFVPPLCGIQPTKANYKQMI